MPNRTLIKNAHLKTLNNQETSELLDYKHDVKNDLENITNTLREDSSNSTWLMAADIFEMIDNLNPYDDPKINRIKHAIINSKVTEFETLMKNTNSLRIKDLIESEKSKEIK